MKEHPDKSKWIIIIAVIGVTFLLLKVTKDPVMPIKVIDGGQWDLAAQVAEQDLTQYLVETPDFDYSNPAIQTLATELKQSASSPYDAVKKTARYVYDNVDYSSKISIQYCYDETASKVLETGSGDCVSMSRLNTALLRTQGIPARTVGGCLASPRCSALFSTYPGATVQDTEMQFGDFKKRGFLHEWVEVWTPESGWVYIESTSGQVFAKSCGTYLMYSYDKDNKDRCVINDNAFWNQCRVS